MASAAASRCFVQWPTRPDRIDSVSWYCRRTLNTKQRPQSRRSRGSKDGEKLCVFFLALRRERPLFAKSFVELRAEKRRFHTSVDDVPRQHRVARAVPEDEEIRVHAGLRHGRAPL